MSGTGHQAHRWRLGHGLPEDGQSNAADENKPLLQPMDLPEIPSRPPAKKANANQYAKLLLCKPKGLALLALNCF